MEAETTTRGPDAPYAKLADVARRFGVSASGSHSALADARTTLAVVRAPARGALVVLGYPRRRRQHKVRLCHHATM